MSGVCLAHRLWVILGCIGRRRSNPLHIGGVWVKKLSGSALLWFTFVFSCVVSLRFAGDCRRLTNPRL